MHTKAGMKGFVVELLKSKLPDTYYYHDYRHTLYVLDKTMEIGTAENCSATELDLLYAAALWHDVGYLNIYTGHEEESCNLARQYLPEYGYDAEQIEEICGMIMATKMPQRPKNKLEEILADADLEYLGSPNAERFAAELFQELKALDPSLTNEQWHHNQISFIRGHHYFTDFCREKKQPREREYLEHLLAAS